MKREMHRLSAAGVRRTLSPGRHADGGGLYLAVKDSGAASWVFMWKRDGRRREMGLGVFPAVSLARARERAAAAREAVAEGLDPIAERQREREPTFAECVDRFLEAHESGWSNPVHRKQWRSTLDTYCAPIAARRVSTVGTDDVLIVLRPIWQEKAETASRLRGRIERVLDYARVRGWRDGENPARWRGNLQSLLPPPRKLTRGHHAAMPYRDVPAFVGELSSRRGPAARALELAILTAARTGEVLGATWSEIDLDEAVWTVPADRIKARREHRVPLSKRAVTVLAQLERGGDDTPIFDLSTNAFRALLKRMGHETITAHGFRSAFRDWAGDETSFPREVAEAALAHVVGDSTERAYRRSDALSKRRELMEAWAAYLTEPAGEKVVPLRKRVAS